MYAPQWSRSALDQATQPNGFSCEVHRLTLGHHVLIYVEHSPCVDTTAESEQRLDVRRPDSQAGEFRLGLGQQRQDLLEQAPRLVQSSLPHPHVGHA